MEKKIITCNYCGSKIRIPADKHIRFNCPKCQKEYYAFNGLIVEMYNNNGSIGQSIKPPKNKVKKNLIKFTALCVFVLIIIFSVRFWYDYKDYKKFEISTNVKDYYLYIEKHPNGLYKEKGEMLKNKIWDKMISRYDSLSNSEDRDKKAVDFFKTVLYYMKNNDVSTIYVKFDSTTMLTDFTNYPDSIKNACKYLYSSAYRDINNYSYPNDVNTISIRQHFTTGKLVELQEIIFKGLTKTFHSIFGSDFISLKPMEKEPSEAKVVIDIKYIISNAYISGSKHLTPKILPYIIGSRFSKNVPGISIDFNGSKIEIPSIKKVFEFGSKQGFENKDFQVEDIQDAYGQLTRSCFKIFVEKFSTQFGLFNYTTFNKRASQIVLNIISSCGIIKTIQHDAMTNHRKFDKENYANDLLEELRKSSDLFTEPQKLESDSLTFVKILRSKGYIVQKEQ